MFRPDIGGASGVARTHFFVRVHPRAPKAKTHGNIGGRAWGEASVVKVEAVVHEHCLDAVVERLVLIGVRGLTIVGVKGAGHSAGYRAVFRGGVYFVAFAQKVFLEWVGPDEEADAVVRAIEQRGGLAEILIQRVDEAVRIRTGERGPGAA